MDTTSATYKYLALVLPAICTLITFVLLSPILLRKQPIAETLHCNGDLRFFGDPFPESIVEMKRLRRTPKPSKPWTYEKLIYRNLIARLRNLRKPQFWKLLWERWVLRGLTCKGQKKNHGIGVLDVVFAVFWLPVCMVLVVLHIVPIFSVWANYIRRKTKEAFGRPCGSTSVLRRILSIFLLFMQFLGIFIFYLMAWDLLVILGQFFVFVSIDILRNATSTLSKTIIVLSIFLYVRNAFQDFEDGYRELKSVTFALCIERAESNEDEDTSVVVKQMPYEPLYVRTQDGESSIPRRVFYQVCQAYRPYCREVMATFTRLFFTFALITVIFVLIMKFNIFNEFSEMGEPMLTVATVYLPSVLGLSKSPHHQDLSHQRRELHLRIWLEKITTTRRVNVNLTKPTKRVISTC